MMIKSSSENIEVLLKYLRTEKEFSRMFDGSIGNGRLEGFYVNLAKNQSGISSLKIVGEYSIGSGEITIKFKRTNVFYVSMIASMVFVFKGSQGLFFDSIELVPSIVMAIMGVSMMVVHAIVYRLEKLRFKKHILKAIDRLKIQCSVDKIMDN